MTDYVGNTVATLLNGKGLQERIEIAKQYVAILERGTGCDLMGCAVAEVLIPLVLDECLEFCRQSAEFDATVLKQAETARLARFLAKDLTGKL